MDVLQNCSREGIMLLTDKMEGPLLLDPALTNGLQCDKLRIITGYADCERMSTHLIALHDGLSRDNKLYVSGIRIEIILGMVKGTGLTRKKHQKICQTIKRLQSMHGMPKISCSTAGISSLERAFLSTISAPSRRLIRVRSALFTVRV